MNNILKSSAAIMLLATIVTLSACKKNFEQPPAPTDAVGLEANTSIATLKALHTVSAAYDVITSDIIISGIVTANDKSGNLYKQIFIQDTTGAMQVMIEAASLYGTYPVGRRVFIRCKGLCLTDYHGTMQMGLLTHDQAGIPSVQGILGSNLGDYVIGGSIGNPVEPLAVTTGDLGTNMQNRYINAFIQLEDFEVDAADTSKTYSDTSAYKNTENRAIENCTGSSILVRNSAYASFAAFKMPKGNGSIAAIYTIYNSDKQLLLRDTSDVKFYNLRCGAAPSNALLYEDFEAYPASSTTPYVNVSIPDWVNVAEGPNFIYTNRIFSGNKYAYVSAFNSALTVANTWLVTKAVDLDATTNEQLSFSTKQDFRMTNYTGSGTDVASTMRVMYSTNYTGSGDPFAAGVIWTDLTGYTLSPGTTSGSPFPTDYTVSGSIDLSAINGIVRIAFKNEGSDQTGTANDHTSSWEIDNILIVGD